MQYAKFEVNHLMKKRVVLFDSEEECCGCSACMSICPQHAVTMSYNSSGDLFPRIDYDKCVGCKLCEKVCAFKHPKLLDEEPVAFFYRLTDEVMLKKSQSGGVAYAISEFILKQNGVLFGVGIDDGYHVKTSCIKEIKCLDKFCGSKYVQSELDDSFLLCKEALNNGKVVLFIGTGCQIDGLLSFLELSRTKTDNLYTMDIVCHGVPGQKKWLDYISLLEKRMGSRVVSMIFRDKEKTGWRGQVEKYTFEDGREYHLNYWARSYQRCITYRDACFECKYTSIYRNSDFTVGDFWGVENYYPELNDNKGVSIVLAHTLKGLELLQELSSDSLQEVKVSQVIQPCLKHPVAKKPLQKVFKFLYKISPSISIRLFIFPSFITNLLSILGNRLKLLRKN